MLQDKSDTSPWTGTTQGPAEGSLLPEEFDSLGGKSQRWWQGMRQSLLRHTEHPAELRESWDTLCSPVTPAWGWGTTSMSPVVVLFQVALLPGV